MRIEIEIEYTDWELPQMIDEELEAIEDLDFEKVEQDGFDGIDLLLYFVVTGGAASVIKDICKVLIKIISRNDAKVVKVGRTEIKGYSEKQVEKLLEKISNVQKNKK